MSARGPTCSWSYLDDQNWGDWCLIIRIEQRRYQFFLLSFLSFFTHVNDTRGSKAIIRVCLSVCPQHNSKTNDPNVFMFDKEYPTTVILQSATNSTVVKALPVPASLVKRRYTKYLGFTFMILGLKGQGQGHRVTKCKTYFRWLSGQRWGLHLY